MIVPIIMLIIGNVKNNDRFLLIVRGDKKVAEEARTVIESSFDNKAKFRVENSTKDTVELIYEVSQKVLEKSKKRVNVSDALYKLEGIEAVNLVCQNDEINR